MVLSRPSDGSGGCFAPPGRAVHGGQRGSGSEFEECSALLRELADVEVKAKQVERVAEQLGAEIAQKEQQTKEPLCDRPSAPTLYLGMDGAGVPMRATELGVERTSNPTVRPRRAR